MPDKPPQSEGERTQTASNEFIQQLAEAIDRLAEKRSAEYSAEFTSRVSARLNDNEENVKAQAHAMAKIAERLGELAHQGAARSEDLDLAQKRAVLRYNAYCTALGRSNQTSVVIGTLIEEREQERLVLVSGQQVTGHRHKLVAFDGHGNEVGQDLELVREHSRGRGEDDYQWSAAISGHGARITHFEVWDDGGPSWLGLIQPRARVRANT